MYYSAQATDIAKLLLLNIRQVTYPLTCQKNRSFEHGKFRFTIVILLKVRHGPVLNAPFACQEVTSIFYSSVTLISSQNFDWISSLLVKTIFTFHVIKKCKYYIIIVAIIVHSGCRLGKAILKTEKVQKPAGGQGCVPDLAGGLR